MAKLLKDILGEAALNAPHHGRESAEGEVSFKKKHTDNVDVKDYPVDTKDQHKADKVKKDKSKLTHLEPEAEKAAYEEIMADIEDMLNEDGDIFEGVYEQIKSIAESGEDAEVELNDDTLVEVDVKTAESIIQVLEYLTDENREQFLDKLESNQEDFFRMIDFAISIAGEGE